MFQVFGLRLSASFKGVEIKISLYHKSPSILLSFGTGGSGGDYEYIEFSDVPSIDQHGYFQD